MTQQELLFRGAEGDQTLWSRKLVVDDGIAIEETLEWLTITVLQGRRVVLDVASVQYEHSGGYRPPSWKQKVYFAVNEDHKNAFVPQSTSTEGNDASEYGDELSDYLRAWRSVRDGVQLHVTKRRYGMEDKSYLNDQYSYRRYQLL